MDSAKLDSDHNQALVAEFHLVDNSTARAVDSTVSVYIGSEKGASEIATVVYRAWTHLYGYQQRWTFEGEEAHGKAMSKALGQMGWGELREYTD